MVDGRVATDVLTNGATKLSDHIRTRVAGCSYVDINELLATQFTKGVRVTNPDGRVAFDPQCRKSDFAKGLGLHAGRFGEVINGRRSSWRGWCGRPVHEFTQSQDPNLAFCVAPKMPQDQPWDGRLSIRQARQIDAFRSLLPGDEYPSVDPPCPLDELLRPHFPNGQLLGAEDGSVWYRPGVTLRDFAIRGCRLSNDDFKHFGMVIDGRRDSCKGLMLQPAWDSTHAPQPDTSGGVSSVCEGLQSARAARLAMLDGPFIAQQAQAPHCQTPFTTDELINLPPWELLNDEEAWVNIAKGMVIDGQSSDRVSCKDLVARAPAQLQPQLQVQQQLQCSHSHVSRRSPQQQGNSVGSAPEPGVVTCHGTTSSTRSSLPYAIRGSAGTNTSLVQPHTDAESADRDFEDLGLDFINFGDMDLDSLDFENTSFDERGGAATCDDRVDDDPMNEVYEIMQRFLDDENCVVNTEML